MDVKVLNHKGIEISVEKDDTCIKNLKTGQFLIFRCLKCGKEVKKPTTPLKKRGVDLCEIKYDDVRTFTCQNCLILENSSNSGFGSKQYKKTMKERYGIENPSHSKDFLNKKDKTYKERYGCNPLSLKKNRPTPLLKTEEGRKKFEKTMIEKYGAIHPMKVEEIIDKMKSKNLEKYSEIKSKFLKDNNITLVEDYKTQKINGFPTYYKLKCDYCGFEFKDHLISNKIPICKKCNNNKKNSLEDELFFFINENIEAQRNVRYVLDGKEIDIYIPEKKIGFEFNGLYWHSEKNGKDRKYHLKKTKKAKEKGIRLIHIFEDEWVYKKDIVKSRIKNILNIDFKRIYARKCEIRQIENINDFLNENHIQGSINSSIKLGLFFENELVSVMSFGKKRISLGSISNEREFELLRFANKKGISVIGGGSKLLKFFERNFNPSEIISYSDNRWNTGNLYEKLGFEKLKDTPPNYYYIINKKRVHRFSYRKNVLFEKLNEYDEKLTEYENMLKNGYDRIWDCGSSKWVKRYEE